MGCRVAQAVSAVHNYTFCIGSCVPESDVSLDDASGSGWWRLPWTASHLLKDLTCTVVIINAVEGYLIRADLGVCVYEGGSW